MLYFIPLSETRIVLQTSGRSSAVRGKEDLWTCVCGRFSTFLS